MVTRWSQENHVVVFFLHPYCFTCALNISLFIYLSPKNSLGQKLMWKIVLLFCGWFEDPTVYCVTNTQQMRKNNCSLPKEIVPAVENMTCFSFNMRRKVPASIELQRLCDLRYFKWSACFHLTGTLRAVSWCFSVFLIYKWMGHGWTKTTNWNTDSADVILFPALNFNFYGKCEWGIGPCLHPF